MVNMGKVAFECPGSCGELFQGVIDGRSIHVTSPIEKYSRASAISVTGETLISPPLKKVSKAVSDFLSENNVEGGVELDLTSELPIGKGMASSTADIAAALSAVSDCLGISLSSDEIGVLAKRVDPTDGVFFNGLAVYDHHGGDLVEVIDAIPKIEVLILDTGGRIDSEAFNSGRIEYGADELRRLEESFEAVVLGLKTDDPELIGAGATLSARVNQKYLYKSLLEEVIDYSKKIRAFGVNVAHSGTVIGLLLGAGQADRHLRSMQKMFSGRTIMKTRIISGGIKRSVCCVD